jgi:hypothetical protein
MQRQLQLHLLLHPWGAFLIPPIVSISHAIMVNSRSTLLLLPPRLPPVCEFSCSIAVCVCLPFDTCFFAAQMVKPRERNTRYVDAVMTVPKGTLFPMCGMNLAFDRCVCSYSKWCAVVLGM